MAEIKAALSLSTGNQSKNTGLTLDSDKPFSFSLESAPAPSKVINISSPFGDRTPTASFLDSLNTDSPKLTAPKFVTANASLAEIRSGEKVLIPSSRTTSYDPVVELVQNKLKELNITNIDGTPVKSDGIFGPKTAGAIAKLRYSLGLPDGRNIDRDLIDLIVPSNVVLMRGDHGVEVGKSQQLLNAAGVHTKVDSKFGSSTETALKTFEKRMQSEPGVELDGRLNKAEKAKLESIQQTLIAKDKGSAILISERSGNEAAIILMRALREAGFAPGSRNSGESSSAQLSKSLANYRVSIGLPANGGATSAVVESLGLNKALDKLVENKLRILGFSAELKDGGLPKAIAAFQTQNKSEITSTLDQQTLEAILSKARLVTAKFENSPVVLRPGSSSELVLKLNKALLAAGFDIGTQNATDIFSKGTNNALTQWRATQGQIPAPKAGVTIAELKELGIEFRQVSEKTIALVKEFEGCYLKAKLCPGQALTIGHGHTQGVRWGQTTTTEEADKLLRQDLAEAALAVQSHFKTKLTQRQFDALVSFTFNLGDGWMQGSRLNTAIEKGEFKKASDILKMYTKAKDESGTLRELGGLVSRRLVEAEMLIPEA